MIRSKAVHITASVILGVLLIILTVCPLELPERILVALLMCAAISSWIQTSKAVNERLSRAELETYRQESDMRLIRTLNHHRHDWMNDIQVLFGYIKLKKYDNLQGYVENIMVKIQQESAVSKLGMPSLVAYMLTFRTLTNDVKLEVELEQEVHLDELPLNKAEVASVIINMVEAFRMNATPSADGSNVLSVELVVEEDHLLVDCVYNGGYDSLGLQQALERTVFFAGSETGGIRKIHAEFTDCKAAAAIGALFHT